MISKNKYTFWRQVAFVAFFVIGLIFLLSILTVDASVKKIYLYALIPIGLFMIVSLIHQIIFPLDLRIYIVWIFLFSMFALAYGRSAQACVIGACGLFIGKEVGFFQTHKKAKYFTFLIFYLISALGLLRLEPEKLKDELEQLAVSVNALFWTYLVFKHLIKRVNKDIFEEMQKADIEDYFSQYNFNDRDRQMLNEVLDGCKYEEIASIHNLSLSSVKKRLAFLYKKVGVTNQIDFIIKFSKKTTEV